MSTRRLLIVNRGEVALRIMRTAAEQGFSTIALYSDDDANSLHVSRADAAVHLPGRGAAAYLDADSIVTAATTHGCWGVHPGYGFLAEQAHFGTACEAAGLTFVGPTPAQLALFGNKLAAHNLARQCDVPTLAASQALESAAALADFCASQGQQTAVLIKAAAGGGGRGMRVVLPGADAVALWSACSAEALAAFGDGSVYAERYIANARHIEVQILGDGRGAVTHLWERDCSTQRRHQKLIEIAPAPHLSAATRTALLDAALRMARHANYRGLGTFEFLLDADSGAWFFIEANARLQVEHTVTEEVLGLDLVALQLQVATGATLAELGMTSAPAAPRGYAVQLRINAESLGEDGTPRPASGRITRFEPATGPGIRVDSAACMGYAPSPAFDSLLAKLIIHHSGDFAQLLARARRAAREFVIEGITTNLSLLQALLAEPALASGDLNTSYVDQQGAVLMAAAAVYVVPPPAGISTSTASRAAITIPSGAIGVAAPMRASVISIDVSIGASVTRGQPLVILEAMKMHHVVAAAASGTISAILVQVGDVLDEGEALAFLVVDEHAKHAADTVIDIDLDAPRADLDEVRAAHALTLDAARPEALAKRRKLDARSARENVADLCDPDSFIEYGALAIAAQRRRRSVEDLMKNTPADGMIAGFGTVNADLFGADNARCAVMAYDYTVLAGTQGHHNHKKKDRLFEIAAEWKTPVVFFTEGGGGRPGDVDTDELCMSWLDLKTFATWPGLSGVAPRIAVNAGRCYAGNAIIFGCADVTIATANSNIGLAGPAMIEGGGLGKFKPEDIGPMSVQTVNGVVDIACADEREATAAARQLLGYFQGVAPQWTATDQRRLRYVIPENRLRVYDIRAVIDGLADEGSVLELRPHYGVGMVTAFIRIEGQPFGLIANDPRHLGGAIDSEGGEKGGRFLQLCDVYNVPVISLCDTPGFMVGPDSEKTAAVRRGSRLLIASANLRVPLFCIVLRKGYGLGAQAMCGGSTHQTFFTIAWPTAEMGPMGLEGAVELGFRKELEAAPDTASRKILYDQLVANMYKKGKGVSVASVFEIDAVIDPAETRAWVLRGLRAAGPARREPRRYVDVW